MNLIVGRINPDGSVLDDAILYAVNQGANVIQLSLHVGQTNAIDTAIQYAFNNGVIVICASGNSNNPSNNVSYPANNTNVISVGATNMSDQ